MRRRQVDVLSRDSYRATRLPSAIYLLFIVLFTADNCLLASSVAGCFFIRSLGRLLRTESDPSVGLVLFVFIVWTSAQVEPS